MKGLEVIEYIAIEQVPDWVTCCFILGVFFILIPTFVVKKLTKSGGKAILAELASGVIYLVVGLWLLNSGVLDSPTGEYQYKVRITEDVGYVEFTDKYNVIMKNDDGTYIVQKK